MRKGWLGRGIIALLLAGSGWSTTGAAQSADGRDNQLIFAVVVREIFNQGNLALADDFIAKDVTNNGAPLGRDGFKALVRDLRADAPGLTLTAEDVVAKGDRVIGYMTQLGGGAPESRMILVRIDDGLVQEFWSWTTGLSVRRASALRAAARQPAASTP